MANVIKYNTGSVPINAIKSGNFDIGVNFGGYGSTASTGYWNGKTPNVSGYTVYVANGVSSPILYAAANDSELIGVSNQLGGGGNTTIGQALTYFNSSSTITCVNVDYSNIVTRGLVLNLDAGFTPSYPKTGTSWSDISGSGNTGTLINGVSYDSGNNGSLAFDGVDDSVINIGSLSTFSFIQNTGIFTISAWVRLTDLVGGARYFIGNNRNTGTEKGFLLGFAGTSGRLRFQMTNGTTSILVQQIDNYFLDDSWVFITVVGDGTNAKYYKNGVQSGTSANFGTLSTGDSSRTLAVGRVNDLATLEWLGNVAQTSIYNVALTPQEVLQNYYAGNQRFIPTSNLVLWLDGNNTNTQVITPTIANDISGNNNTGTLTNGVTLLRDGQRSFSFDGSDDYINCGNIMPSGDYTKVVIFKVPNFSFSDNLVSGGASGSHYLYLAGTPYLRTGHFNGGEAISSYQTIVNTWNFAVVTFSTTSGFAIYQNGNTVVGSNSSTGAFTGGNSLNLGSYGGSFLLQGQIGVAIVYNRVLTTTEILNVYNAYKGRFGYA